MSKLQAHFDLSEKIENNVKDYFNNFISEDLFPLLLPSEKIEARNVNQAIEKIQLVALDYVLDIDLVDITKQDNTKRDKGLRLENLMYSFVYGTKNYTNIVLKEFVPKGSAILNDDKFLPENFEESGKEEYKPSKDNKIEIILTTFPSAVDQKPQTHAEWNRFVKDNQIAKNSMCFSSHFEHNDKEFTSNLFLLFNADIKKEDTAELNIKLAVLVSKIEKLILFNSYQNSLKEILQQQLRTAIISILIDSYAHNISAHSITALKWWFEQRSRFLSARVRIDNPDKEENPYSLTDYKTATPVKGINNFDFAEALTPEIREATHKYFSAIDKLDGTYGGHFTSLLDYIQYMGKKQQSDLLKLTDVVRFPVPLDYAIYPFFKFLLEKGAFWSGVTRDTSFGGEIKSLYEILYDDFILNPLYLGTIANSEGISRLNVYLRFEDDEEFKNIRQNIKVTEIPYKGYSGTIGSNGTDHTDPGFNYDDFFAEINLSAIAFEEALYNSDANKKNGNRKDVKYYNGTTDSFSDYAFVRLGERFPYFREALKRYKVFLPGGVVGKHALFTLIENTIRNVKHYKNKFDEMRSDGLDLYISIGNSDNYRIDNKSNIYRIGVWLDYKVESAEEKVKQQREALKLPILTDSGSPKLGGTSQDKICAAMLLTNKFINVQSEDDDFAKEVRKQFSAEEPFNWVEVGHGTPDDNGGADLKKYFHLWKGEEVRIIKQKEDILSDNLSRFKIVCFEKGELETFVRKAGVIRAVEADEKVLELSRKIETEKNANEKERLEEERKEILYIKWLNKWIKGIENKTNAWDLTDAGTAYMHLHLSSDSINFMPKLIYEDNRNFIKELNFAHGGKKEDTSQRIIDVRSHGHFIEHYFHGTDITKSDNRKGEYTCPNGCLIRNRTVAEKRGKSILPELLETIASKIVVFDNRIYERIKDTGKLTPVNPEIKGNHVYFEQLSMSVYPEIFDNSIINENKPNENQWGDWITFRNSKEITEFNFLVMHLSFIESMVSEVDNQKYSELTINKFIEEELSTVLGPNSILVITTGRGRSEWYKEIQQSKSRDKNGNLIPSPWIPFVIFRPVETLVNAVEEGVSYKDDFQIKSNLVRVLFGS